MLAYPVTDWTEEEKAIWVLEHGEPDVAWIFERNGERLYRRPLARHGGLIPPWISLTREEVDAIVKDERVMTFIPHKSQRTV